MGDAHRDENLRRSLVMAAPDQPATALDESPGRRDHRSTPDRTSTIRRPFCGQA